MVKAKIRSKVDDLPTTYAEAVDYAKEYDARLRSTDRRFDGMVVAIHDDGSVMQFQGAFVLGLREWTFIFTEHHGYRVYYSSDIKVYHYTKRI